MNAQEEWRAIRDRHGADSKYDVSTLGRVRSQNTGFEGRILKGGEGPASNNTAIRRVWLNDVYKGASTPVRVDQVVARTFLGQPKDDVYTVVHKNGCVWDDRVENLTWLCDTDRATPTPLPQSTPTIEQLRSRETAARKALQRATEELVAALRDVARAEAAEAVQRGVEEIARHGLG
jgi:hypothetical protein